MRRSLLLVLAALAAVAAEAQPSLATGDRVRVHTDDQVWEGTFVSFEDDVVLVSQGGPADAFAYDDVRQLEARVRRSRWRGAGRGALIGAGVGAAAGLGYYALAATADSDGWGTGFAFAIGTFIILPATTATGAALGALAPGKKWAIVPGSAASLRPVALGSGGGAALRVRF